MELYKNKFRVETSRMKEWDYSKFGYYFITICTKKRISFFGRVVNNIMELSKAGRIAGEEWENTGKIRKNIRLDEFIIMPNHFHAIVIIEDCNRNKSRDVLQNVSTINKNMSVISPASNSLGTIIRAFKAAVTRKCKQIKINGFGWQERFYDHIIRNENSLNKIRGYIKNNVIKWELDEYHPDKLRIREDL